MDEHFADNRRQWPDDPQSTAWFAGGAYRLFARQAGQFVAVSMPGLKPVRGAVVTARFQKISGPPGGGYGLIVLDEGPDPLDGKNQRGRFYVLEVNDVGQMGAWRRDDDHWVELEPWTPSPVVQPGTAINELTTRVSGSQLDFSINGTLAWTVISDNLPAEGTVGVFVGGDLNEVALEQMTVQVPE